MDVKPFKTSKLVTAVKTNKNYKIICFYLSKITGHHLPYFSSAIEKGFDNTGNDITLSYALYEC